MQINESLLHNNLNMKVIQVFGTNTTVHNENVNLLLKTSNKKRNNATSLARHAENLITVGFIYIINQNKNDYKHYVFSGNDIKIEKKS